eukprot:scaffold149777_cov35-Attheya_sp.AAC.2
MSALNLSTIVDNLTDSYSENFKKFNILGVLRNTLYQYMWGLPAPCTYWYGVLMSEYEHRASTLFYIGKVNRVFRARDHVLPPVKL